jgi:hypothetical protein
MSRPAHSWSSLKRSASAPLEALQEQPVATPWRRVRRLASGPDTYDSLPLRHTVLLETATAILTAESSENCIDQDKRLIAAITRAQPWELTACNYLQGTLLLAVCRAGASLQVVQSLLDRGGDLWCPELINAYGRLETNLDSSTTRVITDEFVGLMDCVQAPWLLAGSAWSRSRDAKDKHNTLLRLLLRHGLDINAVSKLTGLTALRHCIEMDEPEAVTNLLGCGADVFAFCERLPLPIIDLRRLAFTKSDDMCQVLQASYWDDCSAVLLEEYSSSLSHPLFHTTLMPVVVSFLTPRPVTRRLQLPAAAFQYDWFLTNPMFLCK